MKKVFLFLFMSMFLFSFAAGAVNEQNNFRYGESDDAGNLIKVGTPVTGVSVSSFVCSVADCSGSAGNLWGNLYTASDNINLVFPTVLMSPGFGYGFWMLKDGYIPAFASQVTLAGTGTVSPYDNYLTKKQSCSVSVTVNATEALGVLFVEVDAFVDSPIIENYGSLYVPSEVLPHLETLVGISIDVYDSSGSLVWNDRIEQGVGYSASEVFSFYSSLGDGSYTVNATSDLLNEPKCLSYVEQSDVADFTVAPGFIDRDFDDDGFNFDVDCDDNNSAAYPGGTEVNGDGVDNDCDGFVDELPVVVASADVTSGNVSLVVQFNAAVTGGVGSLNYDWDFGNGESSTLQNPVHVYDVVGSFIVSVVVTDSDRETDTSNSLTINTYPDGSENFPVITNMFTQYTLEVGETDTINLSQYEYDLQDSGASLVWSYTGGDDVADITISGKTLTIKGTDEGSEDLVLRLTDSDGNYDEQVVVLRVRDGTGSSDDDDDDDENRDRFLSPRTVRTSGAGSAAVLLTGGVIGVGEGFNLWIVGISILALAVFLLVFFILRILL